MWGRSSRWWLGQVTSSKYLWGMLAAILLVSAGFTYLNSNFATTTNLGNVVEQSTILGIIATGLTFAIVAGEIDLSVGAIYGVCTIVFALLLERAWTPVIAVVATLGAGALMGLFNGALGVGLNVPTIIITLGTLNLFPRNCVAVVRRLPCFRLPGGRTPLRLRSRQPDPARPLGVVPRFGFRTHCGCAGRAARPQPDGLRKSCEGTRAATARGPVMSAFGSRPHGFRR